MFPKNIHMMSPTWFLIPALNLALSGFPVDAPSKLSLKTPSGGGSQLSRLSIFTLVLLAAEVGDVWLRFQLIVMCCFVVVVG